MATLKEKQRDAAAVTFHVFSHHSDRIVMADIAQTVIILQAAILTEGLPA